MGLRATYHLFDLKFKLFTDNKSVSLIFNNPLAKPPLRINHWKHRFGPFMANCNIIHVPGKGNIADFLSRHPMPKTDDEIDNNDLDKEIFVNSIVNYALPKYKSRDVILKHTLEDD